MAKEVDGASSSGNPAKDNYDTTHWTKSKTTSSGQTNTYVGKVGSSEHCHGWKTADGKSDVEHRGHCKVCDDEKGGNNSVESSGGLFGFISGLFS